MHDLLIEFVTEELPAVGLEDNILNPFINQIAIPLRNFNFSSYQGFITPRRFGIVFYNINFIESNQYFLRKGPSIKVGLINNKPTKALIGFANSCNLPWEDLIQAQDGYFYANIKKHSQTLEEILPIAIKNALKAIITNKFMRWGDNEFQFVRPIHNLVILYGKTLLCQNEEFYKIKPTSSTLGHRFIGKKNIFITNASEYFQLIANEANIIPDFTKRKQLIINKLKEKAENLQAKINFVPGLVEEVTGLVECPVILQGGFDKQFLSLPKECLILTMAKNQKYFALSSNDKLINTFLFVANIQSNDYSYIIKGNEKVLLARLNDAKFFYENDQKCNLQDFTPKLANVIYHNQLGNQLDRTIRLQKIAVNIAKLMGIDNELANRTAFLLKADLMTEMINEFPELQGIMGKYYALKSENKEIADAIAEHYLPRFSEDNLPKKGLSKLMAISDKIETLVGIWGLGLIPTAEKDPFALRRASLGLSRILLETDLNLHEILSIAYEAFADTKIDQNSKGSLLDFIYQRLHFYLTDKKEYSTSCVNSVIKTHPSKLNSIEALLDQLESFVKNNQSILNMNKRIENILKNTSLSVVIEQSLLIEQAEKELYSKFIEISNCIQAMKQINNWQLYFSYLEALSIPLENFFANVLVLTEDKKIRQNRINLLGNIFNLLNQYCKINEI